jgi:hypothetical protein
VPLAASSAQPRPSVRRASPRGRRRVAVVALAILLGGQVADAQDAPKRIPGGASVEIRGEVVELGCYLRDGSRGEGHRTCALACLKNGGQLAIVQDETGTLYPLAGATPASDPSAAARQHVAARVAVRGQLFQRNGGRALVVEWLERLSP